MNFNKNAAYTAATNRVPNHTSRPVIGITGNYGDRGLELGEGYYRSIEAAGGDDIKGDASLVHYLTAENNPFHSADEKEARRAGAN